LADNKTLEKLTDEELIKRYQASRDKEIVGILFKRYTRFVFLVCLKYLTEEEMARDAAMQVFESLFVKLRKHEIRNFKPWLHIISKNHCLLQLRKKRETIPLDSPGKDKGIAGVESPPPLYLTDEKEMQLKQLDEAIQLLSKEQRVCIELFYLREKHYDEVSEETGYSYKQVKSYIQNGKRNLRIIMERKNEQ